MALLKSRSLGRLTVPMLLAAFGCAIASCTLMGVFSGGGATFGFSHVVHAEQGLECGDCHTTWESDDAPGMPVRGGCDLCHQEIDANKPPEKRIDSLFDGDTYKASHVSKLSGDVVFSHQQHATKPIECQSCHVGIRESQLVDNSLALGMKDCQKCHQDQSVANECATCHTDLRVDRAPATHEFQWQKLHGRTVRAQSVETVNDCNLCHTESTCTNCHQSQLPDNHNNYFRLRGHGLQARMDRQNCAACHRSESCDECHRITRPMNHRGSFGSTLSTHCVNCHMPIQQTECFACHKSTPSHDLAAPKPPDHTAGMNCRLCHGAGQPLPHVDNGGDCNACHR